jgi:hypothetical protein
LNKTETGIKKEEIENEEESQLVFVYPLKETDSKDFIEVINNQKDIKQSIDKYKLNQLFTAITECNWKNKIFQDPHLPYLALTLFRENYITRKQFETWANFEQINEQSCVEIIFPILDEKDNLTKDANKLMRSIESFLTKSIDVNLPDFLIQQILRRFQLLLPNIPKSEQIFYSFILGSRLERFFDSRYCSFRSFKSIEEMKKVEWIFDEPTIIFIIPQDVQDKDLITVYFAKNKQFLKDKTTENETDLSTKITYSASRKEGVQLTVSA